MKQGSILRAAALATVALLSLCGCHDPGNASTAAAVPPVASNASTDNEVSSPVPVPQTTQAAPNSPSWVRLPDLGTYPVAYYDASHISRHGQLADVWIMQDFPVIAPGPPLPFGSVKFEWEFDCQTDTQRGLAYATYSGRMGAGTASSQDPGPGGPVPAGARSLMSLACGPPAEERADNQTELPPYPDGSTAYETGVNTMHCSAANAADQWGAFWSTGSACQEWLARIEALAASGPTPAEVHRDRVQRCVRETPADEPVDCERLVSLQEYEANKAGAAEAAAQLAPPR
jgi:hypothetical protein